MRKAATKPSSRRARCAWRYATSTSSTPTATAARARTATGEVVYTPPVGETLLRRLLANWERFLHGEAVAIGLIGGMWLAGPLSREIRKIASMEMGIAPKEIHDDGSVLQLDVGSSTGMTPMIVKDNIEFIDEDTAERTGIEIETPEPGSAVATMTVRRDMVNGFDIGTLRWNAKAKIDDMLDAKVSSAGTVHYLPDHEAEEPAEPAEGFLV